MKTEEPDRSNATNQIRDGLFFHAVIQGRDITLQLPKAIQPALLGLPMKSPSFTGRDLQVNEMLSLIRPGGDRQSLTPVYLVAGLGGIGKTELAIQVAHAALSVPGHFPGGALFVDLFGYDSERYLDPGRALIGLLHALGVPEENIPTQSESRSRLFRSILAAYAESGARILLIIDNASSAEQVRPLLPSDGVNVSIVTSRHTLSIGARIHELGVLDPRSAVDLLRKILLVSLGESENRIDVESENAYRLAELCGYLPLALQVCAAMLVDTPRRPVSSLVDSLEAAQSLVDQLSHDDYAVRSVFDLSYARLSESEQRLLGFISFSPGSDIATSAVARLIDASESDTEQLLIDLCKAHLVEQGTAWGRWRLHDLLRLYALERIEGFAGQGDALVRLLDYYLEHSREASELLAGSARGELFSSREIAVEWFDAEHRNLIACVHIAAKYDAIAPYAAEMPHRLARYLDFRRLLTDWKEVMEVSLSLLREADIPEFMANALDNLGMVHRELHQASASIGFHREAIDVARTMSNDEALARYLNNLGTALYSVRDFEGSMAAHAEAAELFLAQGNSLGFARATDNAANSLRDIGRPEEALVRHASAVSKFRESGAMQSEAVALSHMGSTLQDLSRLREAAAAHREAIRIFRQLDLPNLAAHTLINLSHTLRQDGDLETARVAASDALELHIATADPVGQARVLIQLGLIHTDLGMNDQAVLDLEESLQILSNFSGLIDVGNALANLGRVHALSGRFSEAVANLKDAAAVFELHNATTDVAMVRELISALSLTIGADERSQDG
ncbi:ATP-binding protein [Streptomyces sp. NPDC020377]|uniref:ATP-binding protein n=1 Tax=Streptomyces sp. NPDC020377 TaxID=3365070 RepID=UPI0037A1AE93